MCIRDSQLTLDAVEQTTADTSTLQTDLSDVNLNSTAPLVSGGDDSAEASKFGFEGDPCPECGQFTLVSNGSCLKCVSCGSTTGCS